ncbi:type II toxin-antitoxin system RelB/DinJ family antitoxin [Pseudomonas cichorii]|uniref:type II toxin-antitoxin system RelB/DinJ family antitoxin n=1 Tax=Pseudomonas cichorii TaxID=36746 RepID=UPI00390C4B7D
MMHSDHVRYLETEADYLREIEEGIADAEAGRLTDLDTVKARWMARYVAERGQIPFKAVLMKDEDKALLATVRERSANPQRVRVSLDDL